MSFKTLVALFILVGQFIANAQVRNPVEFEKFSVFKNNQYLLSISVSEKMHPADRKVLNFWIEKFLNKEEIVIVKDVSQKEVKERYFLGFFGQIKIKLEFPQFKPLEQAELSSKLCKKLSCDFAIRGNNISHYAFKKDLSRRDRYSKKLDLNFVKDNRILKIKQSLSEKNKKGLFENINYELVFWGDAQKIITYKKPKADKETFIGTFYYKDYQKFKITKKALKQNKLMHLLKNSDADCIFTSTKDTTSFCQGKQMREFPKTRDLPRKVKLLIESGSIGAEIHDVDTRNKLHSAFIRDSGANAVYDEGHIQMISKETKEDYVDLLKKKYSKYEWGNYHPNIIIEYYKKYKKLVTVKYDNLQKTDSDKVHELVVEATNPTYFKVFEWRPDNAKNYIGRYEPKLRPALQQSIDRKLTKQTNLSVALRLENKKTGMSTDSSIKFAERKNSEDITFQNIHVRWWNESKKWGIKGNFEMYKYRYTVNSSSSGSQTIILGEMSELNLMGTYRYPKTYEWADKLEIAGGVNKKDYIVHTNASIGDVKLTSYPIEIEATKKFRRYLFSYAASVAWIQDAQARFDNGTTGGDGWGYWYQANGQIAYPLYKNTFFTIGTMIRQGKIKYPSGGATLNEFGIYVGVEYLKIDF